MKKLLGADFFACCIISTQEPFAVPACIKDCLVNFFDFFFCVNSFFLIASAAADGCVLFAVFHEHSGDENGLSNRSLGRSCRLERFARLCREAVQVQTVIPVSTADQRQFVRSEMGYGKVEGTFQVLHQRLCLGGIVVEINLLVENREISGLFEVGGTSGDQPERVIVEAASDIHVSFFRQWLVLMVCASVFKLGSGNIEQTLSCAIRDQMNEAEQILAGVTEAHAAAGAGLKVGCGTGHVEGNHTLILVPDVDHASQFFICTGERIFCQQAFPVGSKLCKCCVNLLVGLIVGEHLFCRFFVDHARSFPFVIRCILTVAENEDKGAGLAWF